MKKFFAPVIGFLFITITACNNSDKKNTRDSSNKTGIPATMADSLMEDVMAGHDAGMGKMGKLNAMQKEVQKVLDSIAKLPAKTKTAMDFYKAKMEELLQDLRSAKLGMEKWMDEFNMDSAENNLEQRIKYLSGEKLKIFSVKESMLNSLHKADSLLKIKF